MRACRVRVEKGVAVHRGMRLGMQRGCGRGGKDGTIQSSVFCRAWSKGVGYMTRVTGACTVHGAGKAKAGEERDEGRVC